MFELDVTKLIRTLDRAAVQMTCGAPCRGNGGRADRGRMAWVLALEAAQHVDPLSPAEKGNHPCHVRGLRCVGRRGTGIVPLSPTCARCWCRRWLTKCGNGTSRRNQPVAAYPDGDAHDAHPSRCACMLYATPAPEIAESDEDWLARATGRGPHHLHC